MECKTDLPVRAEIFSAVVAVPVPSGANDLDPSSDSTWCGGGMARTKDD